MVIRSTLRNWNPKEAESLAEDKRSLTSLYCAEQ